MIDDQFPTLSQNDPWCLFCQISPQDDGWVEAWPILFEKAYAKLHWSYKALDGGRPEHAIVDLTNGISELIDFEEEEFNEMKNDGTFWSWISDAANNRHLMCASSHGKSDKNISSSGIVEAHAYSILDALEVDIYKLVFLWNPWGKQEWQGDWSDKDVKNWTP